MATWVSKEFENISFGDSRLNERFLKITSTLLEKPSGCMSEITGNWAESKASYRFFGNVKVTKDEILKQHVERTVARAESAAEVVLAIQDTTYLDFTHHPKTLGLGKLTRPQKNRPPLVGFVLHNTLAVTPDGQCLGLLDQKIYRRSAEDVKRTQPNKLRPIEKKESYRWIEAVKNISSSCSNAKIVYVCDREGDIFEFFNEVVHHTKSNFLIRAANDRVIGTRCSRSNKKSNSNLCLWEFMNAQIDFLEIQVDVGERKAQAPREATCELRFAPITYTPPQRRPGAQSENLLPVNLYAIWIKEMNPKNGLEPLEWMLLTDIPILTFESALEKLKWYKARWHIENYHKVLKSGCNIEKSKLNHGDKLEKLATLMSIIAARVYQLKLAGRNTPHSPCTDLFKDEEWKILYQYVHKRKTLPGEVPTAQEVMLWIAKLGGFLGRKSDGNPGSIVIWRGLQRFTDIYNSWKTFQYLATCG